MAKESRDLMIANWKWTETPNYQPKNGDNFGSGYPSDPKAKSWVDVNCNVDPPFGFPDFVRFSWGPAKTALQAAKDSQSNPTKKKNGGPIVRWEADDDNEDESGGKQSCLDSFMVAKKEGITKKRGNLGALMRNKRTGIFNELGLSKTTKFLESN